MDIKNVDNVHYEDIGNSYDNNNVVSLSKVEYEAIKEECLHYEDIRAASIEALKIVQKNRGWISDSVIILIAQILHISVVDLEGVATFYNQIFRQPVGRHIIRYCDSVVCYLYGCKKIQLVLTDILGVTLGGTTIDDRFTLLPMCCVGICNKAPIIMINSDVYCNIVPAQIIPLLESYV